MTDNTPLKQDFRHAMASCAAGRYGITMTAVSSITDEPPTVMLCINRSAAIIPILQTNRDLCINVLSAGQQDVAEHFAGITQLSPEERFEYHIWHRGGSGQLQVEGALAHMHGRIVAQHDIGTHCVFYVEISEIKVHDAERAPALVYFRRHFHGLA